MRKPGSPATSHRFATATTRPAASFPQLGLACTFPVILKPAAKPEENAFTNAKAWLARDVASLRYGYDEACRVVPPAGPRVHVPGDPQAGREARGERLHECESLARPRRRIASLRLRRGLPRRSPSWASRARSR